MGAQGIYCDRCHAFRHDDGDGLPSGIDKEANLAAHEAGLDRSPDAPVVIASDGGEVVVDTGDYIVLDGRVGRVVNATESKIEVDWSDRRETVAPDALRGCEVYVDGWSAQAQAR